MLCEVKQTVSGLRAEFTVLEGGQTIGSALFPDNFLFGGPCVLRYRDEELSLRYDPQPPLRNLGRPVEERTWAPYTVASGGQRVGEMCDKMARCGLFSRYGYTAMTLDGVPLEMFEVGLGKEGIVWPVWAAGRQIAQIEKGTTVRDNLDAYTLCSLGEWTQRAAVLLCLYLDARAFARRGQIAVASVEKSYLVTFNKALKAKYDPGFHHRAAPLQGP
ncbi:hypothetical protein [Candidatus Allofournierella excrementigallinarum]|uniref:hypothetical protein n=1 Tax=Candidatus Allofournierella excrementigallinarum TaxID=2838592 RepID=UPI00374EC88B